MAPGDAIVCEGGTRPCQHRKTVVNWRRRSPWRPRVPFGTSDGGGALESTPRNHTHPAYHAAVCRSSREGVDRHRGQAPTAKMPWRWPALPAHRSLSVTKGPCATCCRHVQLSPAGTDAGAAPNGLAMMATWGCGNCGAHTRETEANHNLRSGPFSWLTQLAIKAQRRRVVAVASPRAA